MTVKFHKSSLFITDFPLRIISNINEYMEFYNPCSTRISVGPLYGNECTQKTSNMYKLTISVTYINGTQFAHTKPKKHFEC